MLYQQFHLSNLVVFIKTAQEQKIIWLQEHQHSSWFQNSEKHILVLIYQYCIPRLLLQLAKLLAMGRQTYTFLAWKTFSFNAF